MGASRQTHTYLFPEPEREERRLVRLDARDEARPGRRACSLLQSKMSGVFFMSVMTLCTAMGMSTGSTFAV